MAIEEIRGRRNRYSGNTTTMSGNTTTMSKHGVNGGGKGLQNQKLKHWKIKLKLKLNKI